MNTSDQDSYSPKMNLEKEIKSILPDDGLSSSEIAEKLNIDSAEIESFLYKNLGVTFFQDNLYKWYPKEVKTSKRVKISEKNDIARLCSYYLECIGQADGAEFSCYASNKYGKPDYIEVEKLPSITSNGISDYVISDLNRKRRSDKSRSELFFGYPVSIRKMKSKKGNEFFLVEPVLVYSIEYNGNAPEIVDDSVTLNMSVIYSNNKHSQANDRISELVQLEQELGLAEVSVDLSQVAQRLKAIRPDWNWKDDITPQDLNSSKDISQISEEGIYNKGVFFLSQMSPFTKGLETELSQLSTKPDYEIEETALGHFLNPADNGFTNSDQALLEVLPMNLEQRKAIEKSLSSALTTVTGPPGTGKSQLITNLIINAIWNGQRILFASKNNKAVDVVDIRVNSVSDKSALIRTGSAQYQNRLAEYLIDLLNTQATENDRESYEFLETKYRDIDSKLKQVSKQSEKLLEVRNRLELVDLELQNRISEQGSSYISNLNEINQDRLISLRNELYESHRKVNSPTLFEKLILLFNRKNLLSELADSTKKAQTELNKILSSNVDLDEQDLIAQLDAVLEDTQKAIEFNELKKYQEESLSFEKLALVRKNYQQELVEISSKLWKLWLKLSPDRLDQYDRQKVNQFSSFLKMASNSEDIYNDLGPDAYRKYKQITSEASKFIPAWAVTSLSARGKIPFQAGLFDLVIFDEASQCDIASALPLLYRAKRAVVIGDPKQLSHISGLNLKKDRTLLSKHNIFDDYNHWSYSVNSLYDLASGVSSKEQFVSLRDHHRSHKDIIEFSNNYFYKGNLRVATKYDKLVSVDGKQGVEWVDVKGKIERPAQGSAINKNEALKVVSVIEDLVITKKYQGTIGVVTPFRAQANIIREFINKSSDLEKKLQGSDFIVDTVHKFQGDEKDIIIFSPVIAQGAQGGAMLFLQNNGNLFNVAITRARARLLVVGDQSYALKCSVPYLKKFAEYSQKVNTQRQAVDHKTKSKLGPKYPKLSSNYTVSDWEKVLYEKLYEAGIKTIPQYSIDSYVLDLALIHKDKRLDIEVDGEKYHRNWTGEYCRRDELRNQRMFELGWDVKRFWVYQVRDNIDECVGAIKTWLKTNS